MLNGTATYTNLEKMMSENLAEESFGGRQESDAEEHDQNRVVAIQLAGQWVQVIPGTLELSFGDGPADVIFSVERVDGLIEEGGLSEITGIRSLDGE